MRRSLIHFWPLHLAVVAGAAVATAVLTGSLVVGDSIQASLRDLTLERLGRIEEAVTGERLFAGELAERLGETAVPVMALRGEEVPTTIDTGFIWADAMTIDDPEVQAVLYE